MFQMLQGGPEGETKDVPYKMKFPQDDKVKENLANELFGQSDGYDL